MKALISSWAVMACALFAPAPALAALIVASCHSDFDLSPSSSALGAVADLCGDLVETKINLTVEAHPAGAPIDPLSPTTGAFTSLETASFDTVWGAASGGHLDLSAADKLGQITDLLSPAASVDHRVDTDERNTRLALTLPPWNALDLTLTGDQTERTVNDTITDQATAPKTQSQFDVASQAAAADLKWTLPGGLSLDAGGRLETASVNWRSASGDADLSYGGFEPSVTAATATPGGGKLGLTFEQAVSPIDPNALSAFAAAPSRAADARFEPNREWRYRLDFNQSLVSGLKLDAALIAARLEDTTELGPVGEGVQAPIAVPGGQRSEADLSFSTPLALLGLPAFEFKGAGAWRASQIRDPFTGQLRALSGEAAQTATLDLIQSLPEHRTRWGLEGRFGGDQTLYQMNQVTTVNVADSLGGFVEYDPGAFALRLQVDGLYGGDRAYTNTYYAGMRGDSMIDHIDHRTDSNQAVRLILKKSL